MKAMTVSNLSHVYKTGSIEEHALKQIDLTFDKGKIYAIMGPSGSGKSTLLNVLGGILKPTEGSVAVGDKRINSLTEKELAQLRLTSVGYIFQSFNLVPFLNVEENILLPLTLRRENGEDIKPKMM